MLATGAFEIVYQPIVSLPSGDLVGHEALTRFHTGERPDHVFAAAWAVGIGPEMELATLMAAVEGARALPAGRWLNLNLSPRLFADPARLRHALAGVDRPIVLEVTEHEKVEDYGMVRDAVRSLGDQVRLAVDDAGAGVANFGHIIELGPDFVKLDTSLVRGVNANLGRQALVVGCGTSRAPLAVGSSQGGSRPPKSGTLPSWVSSRAGLPVRGPGARHRLEAHPRRLLRIHM